ncbi:unnamed protein product [Rangifer tarandus platyrhynchus]|uniref:Uncharacterized protein n=1 Tax=Rangifer tarandus platyrhynchus TaxID=3082113 RepID=A0ABN8XNT5_RANTA|nr:unnamed protein product [Rangifer tarandus platyrhynchus]
MRHQAVRVRGSHRAFDERSTRLRLVIQSTEDALSESVAPLLFCRTVHFQLLPQKAASMVLVFLLFCQQNSPSLSLMLLRSRCHFSRGTAKKHLHPSLQYPEADKPALPVAGTDAVHERSAIPAKVAAVAASTPPTGASGGAAAIGPCREHTPR